MKISICTDITFEGKTFAQKAEIIKKLGFDAVEFWSWSNKNLQEVEDALRQHDLRLACCCVDSANSAIRQRLDGCTLNSPHVASFVEMCTESIAVAKRLGAGALIVTVGNSIDGLTHDEQVSNVIASLNAVKAMFEQSGIVLLVEPINRQERPTYLMPNARQVAQIVQQINSPNVKILFDVYHQAMEEDYSVNLLSQLLPLVGHVHVADVPGRHQPFVGNVDYHGTFDMLNQRGFAGHVGAEFVAKGDEQGALAVMLPWKN